MQSIKHFNTRKKILAGLLSVFLLSAAFLAPTPAVACSCAPLSSIEEVAEHSYAIFEGRVIDVDSTTFGYTAEVEVSRSWKKVQDKFVRVDTGRGGPDCGLGPLPLGQTRIFFTGAGSKNRGLSVSSCTPKFARADVIKQLGQGVTNLRDNANAFEKILPPYWQYMLGSIGVVLLGFGLRWQLWRRRNRSAGPWKGTAV